MTFLMFPRQCIKLPHQVRQQLVLNRFPALHDIDTSDRIHLSGKSDDDLDDLIMPEMEARSSFLPFAQNNSAWSGPFARGSSKNFGALPAQRYKARALDKQ